ncbi:kinase-like domain-containing protein [Gigaspora rosea]|uniref:Kinase-like domain-containing protein n=1 Tax=Gigaspora rosea TaxID=44941 RepID=A0A397W0X4_9GLOM|nr:kinase-like domain-containing protein [Gigaspora rosea]
MGNAISTCNVGYFYHSGIGVKKDEHKALIYYQKAAEMGDFAETDNAAGIISVGHCYQHGIGVEKDDHMAFISYRRSVEMGNAVAICFVGYCYQHGVEVEKDEHKAFIYYQNVAEIGNGEGILKVAEGYRSGIGITRDLNKAKYWYQRDIKMFGKGGFATVYHARWNHKREYVYRSVTLKLLNKSNNYHEEFIRELKAYCDIGLNDPTFLKCFGISKDNVSKDYILVMEYAHYGNLRQNLHTIAQLDWKDKLNLLQCIASDLLIIHSHDLIHRDLHSGNILQDNLKSAYIADLGFSIAALKSKSNGIYGILRYIAPEVLKKTNIY